jgi:hypothetical protein
LTDSPFDPAANNPGRRPALPKVKTLADPPDPPGLTVINLVGYAVLRDNDGTPRALQQAGIPRDGVLPASYAVVYERFEDARVEAEEQLIEALAHQTYPDDARHIAPIVVRNCTMRDFRPIAMQRDALETAADHLASGDGNEPWSELARDSAGGLVLSWRPISPTPRDGYFILLVDHFLHCVELEEPVERISLEHVCPPPSDQDR